MCVGDIVFYPTNEGYVKYIIKKIIGDDLLVKSYKSHQLNWINASDVISDDNFIKVYNNERIFD